MKKLASFFRLLSFEWRKNFMSPWLLIFTVLLLCLNAWKLNSEYTKKTAEFSASDSAYEELYARWSGTITAEKIAELMEIYGPLENIGALSSALGSGTYTDTEFSDYRFIFSNFYNEMKYDYLYVNRAIEITERAESLSQLDPKYDAVGDLFQGRKISQFADTRYLEVLLEHDYSAMLVLLLTLFGLCAVFVSEKESQMFMLQRTTRNGGATTVAAKLVASTLYIILLCVLFFGEDFLVLQLLSGHYEALSSPIYALRSMEATPLNMSIGRFILWSGVIRTIGMIGCGCLILLTSCLTKRVLTSFGIGFIVLISMVALQENCRTRMWLKWFDPMELLMVRELINNTNYTNVFGVPMLTHIFVIFGMFVTILSVTLLILRFQPGRQERRCKA